jgi:hypothetical protein
MWRVGASWGWALTRGCKRGMCGAEACLEQAPAGVLGFGLVPLLGCCDKAVGTSVKTIDLRCSSLFICCGEYWDVSTTIAIAAVRGESTKLQS